VRTRRGVAVGKPTGGAWRRGPGLTPQGPPPRGPGAATPGPRRGWERGHRPVGRRAPPPASPAGRPGLGPPRGPPRPPPPRPRPPGRPETRLPNPQLESVQRRPRPAGLAPPLGRPADSPGLAIPGAEPVGCQVPVQRPGHRVPPDAPGSLPPRPAGHRVVRPL